MGRLLLILITCALSACLEFVSFRVHWLDSFIGEPAVFLSFLFELVIFEESSDLFGVYKLGC